MKTKEQIINDSIKCETAPEDYNLLEIHCFLALKQLLIMFHNKQISQKNATRIKTLILAEYEKRYKDYDFQRSMFQEHVQNIKETEQIRTKLRKRLHDKEEVTSEKLAECLNLALEIISKIFKEDF